MWCSSGVDVCRYWEDRLLARLRHPWRLNDVPIDQKIFGKGHSIRTLDVGAEGAGAGEKTVVLLIHGFGNGLAIWFKVVDPLVDAGFRVLCIDLPGLFQAPTPPAPPCLQNALCRRLPSS